MTEPIEYQTLMENGTPKYAVVPFHTFRELLRQANAEPTIPHAVVSAMVDGASAVKAWREYLKLTQQTMAKRLNCSQAAYAQKERSKANLRPNTVHKLANALGILPEQLDL